MNDIVDGFNYLVTERTAIWQLLGQHVTISLLGLLIASLIALPLGLLVVRVRWLAGLFVVLGALGLTGDHRRTDHHGLGVAARGAAGLEVEVTGRLCADLALHHAERLQGAAQALGGALGALRGQPPAGTHSLGRR